MIYLQLAFEFFKAGLFAVGGGLATLPFLIQTSQTYPQWFSVDELMQMVAVSESTPGPIGVNMATYVGFHVAGIPGRSGYDHGACSARVFNDSARGQRAGPFPNQPVCLRSAGRASSGGNGIDRRGGYLVLKTVLLPEQAGQIAFQWIAFALFMFLFGLQRVKKLTRIHPIAYIAVALYSGSFCNCNTISSIPLINGNLLKNTAGEKRRRQY